MVVAEQPVQTDPERWKLILGARERWVRRLIDPSRNNSLLFFRDLKVGTLDVTRNERVVSNLLGGRLVPCHALERPIEVPKSITDPSDRAIAREELREDESRRVHRSLLAIQRKSLVNLEERGLETLFLALGLAEWPAPDGGRPYAAPILLLPAKIDSKGSRKGQNLGVYLPGDPQANLVLLYILEQEYGIDIDPDEMLQACTVEDDRGRWTVDTPNVLQFLPPRCRGKIPGFGVSPRAVLGNFQFAKMAMVEDLRRHDEELVDHSLIAALAGHGPSRRELEQADADQPEIHLDKIPALDDHLVLDADASQHTAIRRIRRGQSGVIQGPPGTGKSQTIANLIADLVTEGKRVLFVAEKRAALDAVIKRLQGVDLGHLVLDLHGASVSRKEVMAQLAESLLRIHSTPPAEDQEVCRTFEARRQRLNNHARRIGCPRQPTGKSLYEMQGLLLGANEGARTSLRFRGDVLAAMSEERVHEISEWLISAGETDRLFLGESGSHWNRVEIRDGQQAQQMVDLSRRLAHELWPEVERHLSALAAQAGLISPESLQAVGSLVELLEAARRLLRNYSREIFDCDLESLALDLEPAGRSFLIRAWHFLSTPRYRDARRELVALRTDSANARTLLQEARQAADLADRWQRSGGQESPEWSETGAELCAAWQSFSEELERLLATTRRTSLEEEPIGEAKSYLEGLAADARTPYQLPRTWELHNHFLEAELGQFLRDLRDHDVPRELWTERLRYAWLHSAVDQALVEDPDLASFDGRAHDRLVEEFADLDRKRLDLTADRVRRRHAESAVSAMNEHKEETDLVKREAQKRSRHLPLRGLLEKAPNVLTRAVPCWVASPLSVSQLLDASREHFDVVLFDEASQVPQEDAIPALLRARQAVVAGDRHQLPPTSFFATQIQEDDEELPGEEVEGFESLLDTISSFLPNWLLNWHYRSRDERLIAFSNHHIYDDRLITFPGVLDHEVLRHELVEHDPGLSGQTRSSSGEVTRVVDLVLEHAERRPEETLGVIAMGITHANRIQAELDQRIGVDADLNGFFSLERRERFFVKNLETVQGDERDAIILSVGYGKAADGRLPHRFGPLTQDTGHRRLNVAVTRARRRMTVVSSFHHREIDLSRSGSRGVELLKAFIEFSMSGGKQLPHLGQPDRVPLNPFEADIKDALEARGLKLLSQFGVSQYRIDLVAMHPEHPGRPVLAIECDGAAYHSSASARERDRLRQEHLMRLNWHFHRIWSTDWFHRRESEIERAVAAYEKAVRRADVLDAADAETTGTRFGDLSPRPRTTLRRTPPPQRDPIPKLPQRRDITEYSDSQLRRLAGWAMSDGLLRTDEELLREMQRALGFKRLGHRIRGRFERAVRSVRRSAPR